MGIKSTCYLDRSVIIDRIIKIDKYLANKMFRKIEDTTCESDNNLELFVKNETPLNTTKELLEQWTDTMLTDKLDEPFYRFSMFDNYLVTEDY